MASPIRLSFSRKFLTQNKAIGIHVYFSRSYAQEAESIVTGTDETKRLVRKVKISLPSKRDPTRAIPFEIGVLDNFPDDVNQELPTVLALHGIFGEAENFASWAMTLKKHNIRLIAPSILGTNLSYFDLKLMPEVDFTGKGIKNQYEAVLKEMKVKRVDTLLGHCMGAYPIYKILAEEMLAEGVEFKSVALFNPNFNAFGYLNRHPWKNSFLGWGYRQRIVRHLFLNSLKPRVRQYLNSLGMEKYPLNTNIASDMQYGITVDYDDITKDLEKIKARGNNGPAARVPKVVAYAKHDPVTPRERVEDIAFNFLGFPRDNLITYLADGSPDKDPLSKHDVPLSRRLLFTKGGHFIHIVYEKQLVAQIQDLLQLVRKDGQP